MAPERKGKRFKRIFQTRVRYRSGKENMIERVHDLTQQRIAHHSINMTEAQCISNLVDGASNLREAFGPGYDAENRHLQGMR